MLNFVILNTALKYIKATWVNSALEDSEDYDVNDRDKHPILELKVLEDLRPWL